MEIGNEPRFLVIGLDGATAELLRPLVAHGELPAIAAMFRQGHSCALLSSTPPITPPAWSSFATGAEPLEHGVFGFHWPDPETYGLRATSAADLHRPTLWQHLSQHGYRVLLIDVPFTYPPAPVNGFVVAGFPLPAQGVFTHPPDLADQLGAEGVAGGRHPNDVPDPATPEFLDWFDAFASERVRLFRHLGAREPWQFAMVGTMALDWAQHALWRYFDRRFIFASEPEADARCGALFTIYRRVDRFVGQLAAAAGEGTIVVLVSDHGFGTTFHYDWVTRALEGAGLLRWRKGGRGISSRLASLGLRAVRSSPWLQRLGKRGLGDLRGARVWARRARSHEQIDWSRTRVFPAGDYNLNLYVNSRDRFAGGIVGSGAEYEAVLAAAIEALEGYRPPRHDRPLVRRVVRIGGGASGRSTRIPDLALELTVLPQVSDAGPVVEAAGLCGFHSPEGVLITDSTRWLPGGPRAAMPITDVAPSILEHLGVPYRGMTSEPPPHPAPALSAEHSEAMLDRLRRLGYLD